MNHAPWPKGFQCPDSMRSHVQRVLDGEYALPAGYKLEGPIRVLDIGANVGAFAVWARRQWPECERTCYEPHPETFKLLQANLGPDATLYEAAVCSLKCNAGAVAELHEGLHNCGEASLHKGSEQSHVKSYLVHVEHAEVLPAAEVLKLDTEGAELDILSAFLRYDPSRVPMVIMLEWHSRQDRWRIGALLCETHDCVRDDPWRPDRGIMVWVKRED